jgi:hypothetical protein
MIEADDSVDFRTREIQLFGNDGYCRCRYAAQRSLYCVQDYQQGSGHMPVRSDERPDLLRSRLIVFHRPRL